MALVLLGIGLILALVPWPEPWVERLFARGLFPVTTHLLAPWVGAVPFSVTGAFLAALVLSLLVALASKRGRRWALRALLPWSLAALVLGFALVWGLAYRRATLAALLHVPSSTPSPSQVAVAESALLETVRATAGSRPPGPRDTAAAARCVASEVKRLTGVSVVLPRRVKLLPAGSLLALGFSGVTSPWLLEPQVDAGLPPVTRLATATHELTHAAGFAREADTDALAVLAGIRCGDPAVRYALALHALEVLWGGLPPSAARRLFAALPARSREDVDAAAAAAARYRVAWLQRAATSAYGAYLKSRGVRAGMADYGRAAVLVIQALSHGER